MVYLVWSLEPDPKLKQKGRQRFVGTSVLLLADGISHRDSILSTYVHLHGVAVQIKHNEQSPTTVRSLFKTEYVIVSSVNFLLVKNYLVSRLCSVKPTSSQFLILLWGAKNAVGARNKSLFSQVLA